jgi:hypothetical protein
LNTDDTDAARRAPQNSNILKMAESAVRDSMAPLKLHQEVP